MMQTVIVYILLGAAILFLLYKFLKPKKEKGCDTDCNCK